MKLPLYIARRYLFAKKSRNAINIISGISVAGVTTGTMALVIILSVFNGLEEMVKTIFGTFDPDIEITVSEGKVFTPSAAQLEGLKAIPGVEVWSMVLEENALLTYEESQYIATVKGVEESYSHITGLDSVMWDGEFILRSETGRSYAVVGQGVANYLGIGLNFLSPINIYLPRRTGSASSISTANAFKREYIFPSGIFSIEQEFDSKYIFVPIDMMRNLLDYTTEVSAIEVKVTSGDYIESVQKSVTDLFGPGFTIKNSYQQHELFYKVMRSERLAIFIILAFILLIASFNIIGSLTMLIIEKKRDIGILQSLGAGNKLIKRIFLIEGWMISLLGAATGMILGVLICWLQQEFGLVKLQGDTLIIDSYPVVVKLNDLLMVMATVLLIGYWAAWYPVRYLSRKYLSHT
ncbi:MAG: ABC transporter permease [Bacteroidales bacterium]|nr:ABC transporter permease [Bacteroidales bacterium]